MKNEMFDYRKGEICDCQFVCKCIPPPKTPEEIWVHVHNICKGQIGSGGWGMVVQAKEDVNDYFTKCL